MALCLSFLSVYHNSYLTGLVWGQSELLPGKDSEHSKCSINASCGHSDVESSGDPGEYTQWEELIIAGP